MSSSPAAGGPTESTEKTADEILRQNKPVVLQRYNEMKKRQYITAAKQAAQKSIIALPHTESRTAVTPGSLATSSSKNSSPGSANLESGLPPVDSSSKHDTESADASEARKLESSIKEMFGENSTATLTLRDLNGFKQMANAVRNGKVPSASVVFIYMREAIKTARLYETNEMSRKASVNLKKAIHAALLELQNVCRESIFKRLALWCWRQYMKNIEIAAEEKPEWQTDAFAADVGHSVRFMFLLNDDYSLLVPREREYDRLLEVSLRARGGHVYYTATGTVNVPETFNAENSKQMEELAFGTQLMQMTLDPEIYGCVHNSFSWLCSVRGDTQHPPKFSVDELKSAMVLDSLPVIGRVCWWPLRVVPVSLALAGVESMQGLVVAFKSFESVYNSVSSTAVAWNKMVKLWPHDIVARYFVIEPAEYANQHAATQLLKGYHLLAPECAFEAGKERIHLIDETEKVGAGGSAESEATALSTADNTTSEAVSTMD